MLISLWRGNQKISGQSCSHLHEAGSHSSFITHFILRHSSPRTPLQFPYVSLLSAAITYSSGDPQDCAIHLPRTASLATRANTQNACVSKMPNTPSVVKFQHLKFWQKFHLWSVLNTWIFFYYFLECFQYLENFGILCLRLSNVLFCYLFVCFLSLG